MIVITGGAGFIGFNLMMSLQSMYEIVVVDNHVKGLTGLKDKGITYLTVEDSFLWLQFNAPRIEFVFHLGARTDTMDKDDKVFERLNLDYSKFIWNFCVEQKIPMIYASSAAVYGDGSFGFNDEEDVDWDYYPMNPYGESKYWFDVWVRDQVYDEGIEPPFWAGLRFFNVYGPNEDHKGRMASVVWHFYNQIKETGGVKLFKSYRDDVGHGFQKRDFIYVKDLVNTMFRMFMEKEKTPSGIYNLGTGVARTYNDLARAVFKSLGKEENITYIELPEELRDSYQYYTQARMDKLRDIGFLTSFTSLEEGIDQYIKQLENEDC